MIVGWILSVEGCEYAFGDENTGGVYSYSSADWSPQWTIVPGALNWEAPPSWTERARSDGGFEGGSLEFTLEDMPAPSGSLAGQPLCTALFTRSPTLVPSTTLAADLSDTSGTVVVDDAAALGLTWPATIIVEREAIRIASAVGNTLTVAASGRGYLGTYPVPHVRDMERLYRPEVWPTLPFVLRRRAILWAASDAGAVSPIWRGTVAKKRLSSDRARFTLSCNSIENLHANAPLGDEYATTRFRGFNVNALVAGVRADSGAPIGVAFRPWDGPFGRPIILSSLSDACAESERRIRSQLAAASLPSTNVRVAVEGSGVVFRLDATGGISNARLSLRVGTQQATGQSTESSGTRRAEARVDGTPPVLVTFAPNYDANILPIQTTARMPTTWAAVAGLTTYAGATTSITPVLRGSLDGDHDVDVYIGSLVGAGSSHAGTPGPLIVGTARIIARDGAPPRVTNTGPLIYQYVDADVLLKVAARVATDHWAAGLANVIGERTVLRSQVTARDWDFSTIPDVIAATFGPLARRTWVFNGSFYLGDLLKEELCLNGCGLSLRRSRLAIVAFGPATANATPAATLSELDAHDLELQDWEELDEEQITGVEADVDGTPIRVNDTRTVGRYMTGRTVPVKLRGREQALRTMADPVALANALMARVIGPYSDPVGLLTFHVSASEWIDRIFIGDYIDISEWLAPDGTGARGVGNAAALAAIGELSSRAQVRGRLPDLAADKLTLELLLFPQVYGYAPACRIASSPTTTSLVVATNHINGVGDYTNPDAGAADGGASKFQVGDKVRLVQMDTVSFARVGPYTVASVVGTTITLVEAIDAAARASIAGGVAWWDLVPADFDEHPAGAPLTRYAYVGSASGGDISGTGTPNRPWSP